MDFSPEFLDAIMKAAAYLGAGIGMIAGLPPVSARVMQPVKVLKLWAGSLKPELK